MLEQNMSFSEQDVILRCGITLRRNYQDVRFVNQMDEDDIQLVEERVGEALSEQPYNYTFVRMAQMDEVQKGVLAENGLVNKLDLQQAKNSSLFVDQTRGNVVVLNAQEHILLRAIKGGLDLFQASNMIHEQEQALCMRGGYAFDTQFGYLTTQPQNAGTALFPWAVLHLPLLSARKDFSSIIEEFKNQGMILSPLDEGAGPLCRRFIMNMRSGLGISEENQITMIHNALLKLAAQERLMRLEIQQNLSPMMLDPLYRAEAVLRCARQMSAKEMMHRLSDLRLGVCLNLFEIPLEQIDRLDLELRPCCLRTRYDISGDTEQVNIRRADVLREFMASV